MSNLCVIWLIVFFLTVSQVTFITRKFIAKLLFDNKKSSNELLRESSSESLIECALNCQREFTCCFFGYNTRLKKCRVHRRTFTSGTSNETGWRYYSHDFLPLDCKDLRDNGYTNTGVYKIYPFENSSRPVRVYCDMITMDGGWTVIQKRIDGSLSFDRNWTDYRNGFGDPAQNVWIGNDVIHQLTKGHNSSLYVSIILTNGSSLYELYDQFSVSDETEKYQLFLAGPAIGTLGDRMLKRGNAKTVLSGMYFSTPDRDNDGWSDRSCAAYSNKRGGWWFNACHHAYLNGLWSSRYWLNPWSPTVTSATFVTETMMLIKRH